MYALMERYFNENGEVKVDMIESADDKEYLVLAAIRYMEDDLGTTEVFGETVMNNTFYIITREEWEAMS